MAEQEPVVAVPTLYSRSNPFIKDPGKVGLSLIQFMFANPGATSGFDEDEMISFRKLVSLYKNDSDRLGREIEDRITAALNRYFPEHSYRCVVDIKEEIGTSEDGLYAGNYSLSINIIGDDGVSLCPITAVKTSENNSKFTMTLV